MNDYDPSDTEMGRRNHERMAALEVAAQPMVEFVNKYCCPHDVVIIQQGSVELYSGQCAFPTVIPD